MLTSLEKLVDMIQGMFHLQDILIFDVIMCIAIWYAKFFKQIYGSRNPISLLRKLRKISLPKLFEIFED